MEPKPSIIFSGGGNRIAWMAGVVAELPQVQYDLVAGSSSGALIGLMLAQGKYDHIEALGSMKRRDIWRYNPLNWLRLRSLADSRPLQRQIDFQLIFPITAQRYVPAFVDMQRGRLVLAEHTRFPTTSDLSKAILASASWPGLFPLVDQIDAGEETYHACADGGMRASIPWADFLVKNRPEDSLIINAAYELEAWKPGNLFRNYLRSMAILQHEVARNDLSQAPGKIRSIRPLAPLPGNRMDFSPAVMRQLYLQGRRDALAYLTLS